MQSLSFCDVKEAVMENNLEKIKKKLHSSNSSRCLLQGPLLKRSETVPHEIHRFKST
jgi:hypothetical protein